MISKEAPIHVCPGVTLRRSRRPARPPVLDSRTLEGAARSRCWRRSLERRSMADQDAAKPEKAGQGKAGEGGEQGPPTKQKETRGRRQEGCENGSKAGGGAAPQRGRAGPNYVAALQETLSWDCAQPELVKEFGCKERDPGASASEKIVLSIGAGAGGNRRHEDPASCAGTDLTAIMTVRER